MALYAYGISGAGNDWILVLRRYFVFTAIANLAWEFAHSPFYTIWNEASLSKIVFAATHCWAGDILIATATLILSLLLVGAGWPASSVANRRVASLTVAFGVGYGLFSEWLNIVVRGAWAYTDLMPVIPFFGAGLSPVLQWIAIPLAAFWWARRPLADTAAPKGKFA